MVHVCHQQNHGRYTDIINLIYNGEFSISSFYYNITRRQFLNDTILALCMKTAGSPQPVTPPKLAFTQSFLK
jgi:hypothetical protein